MKKLSTLLIALFFTAGMAFAQSNGNYAKQSQTGDDNEALIEQIGNGNSATQLQTDDENDADIYQEGNDNSAQQTQSGTSTLIHQVM